MKQEWEGKRKKSKGEWKGGTRKRAAVASGAACCSSCSSSTASSQCPMQVLRQYQPCEVRLLSPHQTVRQLRQNRPSQRNVQVAGKRCQCGSRRSERTSSSSSSSSSSSKADAWLAQRKGNRCSMDLRWMHAPIYRSQRNEMRNVSLEEDPDPKTRHPPGSLSSRSRCSTR